MAKFNVVIKEKNCGHELIQTAVCPTREDVIKWYGLNEPDIEYYKITELV